MTLILKFLKTGFLKFLILGVRGAVRRCSSCRVQTLSSSATASIMLILVGDIFWKVYSLVQRPLRLSVFSAPGQRLLMAPLHQLLLLSHGLPSDSTIGRLTLRSSPSESSLSSLAWHCLPHATPPPQLQRSLDWGSQAKAWQDHWYTMPVRVMLRWDPLRSGNALGFFPTLVFCCRALQPNPVTVPEHSSLIPTAACYRFPQTMRLCYNFGLAGAASIKLWTSKAVYGRTEEFKLHNRQLPCPLTPLPSIQFVVSL